MALLSPTVQPSPRDLTDPSQQAAVLARADALVADPHRLAELEHRLQRAELRAQVDPVDAEAAACAASAVTLSTITTPVHLSVVWAMYRETERMLTRDEHSHGEDFLREKVRQISWLADHNSLLSWQLVAVDDGCPAAPSSADLAERLVIEAGLGHRVTVLRLADAIRDGAPVTDTFDRLRTTCDSRKGGAIAYGLWAAINARGGAIPVGAEHIVLYTDADLSSNLAQAGRLVVAALDGAAAAAGQRYGIDDAFLVNGNCVTAEPDSTGRKPDKMIVLFRHAMRAVLLPDLARIIDTQAGFKAFRAEVIAAALPRLDAFTETFDVELLLHAAYVAGAPIVGVPIVFTEDFAATNFPSVEPEQRHLDMIHQLVDVHDRLESTWHNGEVLALRHALADLDLDGYVRIITKLRTLDEVRKGNDPLFAQRWSSATIADLVEG